MAYFKRATTWLALGKSKAALPDLNKSIKLKEDFTPAILSKASIYLKQGHMDDALKYYKKVVSTENVILRPLEVVHVCIVIIRN